MVLSTSPTHRIQPKTGPHRRTRWPARGHAPEPRRAYVGVCTQALARAGLPRHDTARAVFTTARAGGKERNGEVRPLKKVHLFMSSGAALLLVLLVLLRLGVDIDINMPRPCDALPPPPRPASHHHCTPLHATSNHTAPYRFTPYPDRGRGGGGCGVGVALCCDVMC